MPSRNRHDTRNRHDMGEQDAMGVIRNQDLVRDIDPGRLVRLWPEIDVHGRIGRLLAAERSGTGRVPRSHDPAA
jgi:hypothetical protein